MAVKREGLGIWDNSVVSLNTPTQTKKRTLEILQFQTNRLLRQDLQMRRSDFHPFQHEPTILNQVSFFKAVQDSASKEKMSL